VNQKPVGLGSGNPVLVSLYSCNHLRWVDIIITMMIITITYYPGRQQFGGGEEEEEEEEEILQ
jgi:hypothetical protein